MRFGCLILLMFVVLACGQEKKKETVNPLAYAVIKGLYRNITQSQRLKTKSKSVIGQFVYKEY